MVAALVTIILVWPVANAYIPLGFNTGVGCLPHIGSTRKYLALTQPRTRPAGTRLSCVYSSSSSATGSPGPSLAGSVSRRNFLGSLLVSSAALGVCASSAVGAATTTTTATTTTVAVSPGGGDAQRSEKREADKTSAGQMATTESEQQPAAAASESESAASSAISGLVAGAAVSTSKQLLLHPVDTVKTRLQLPRGGESPELFRGLYDGILPPLLAGLPSGALFFSAKDAFSTAISNVSGGQYADLTTVVAVGLAQFPYWGIRTPAELLKIRSQAGQSSSSGAGLQGAKSILADEGVKGLYTGYSSNIAYAFPADAIKFLAYGALKRSAKKAKGGAKLGTVEAAVLGSGASLVAQAVTTPLDVVRTRVMTASPDDEGYEGGVVGALRTIGREEGFSALWAGTTPRVARSVLSGAIQFGSYEFVKGLFGVEPRKL